MRTMHMERVFDAPRALVWKAFTDPDQVAEWFGPIGYSVPRESVSMDLRVGGFQKLTMVPNDPSMPSGGESCGIFDELVDEELIVTHEDLDDEMAAIFGTKRITMKIELRDEGAGTRLVLTQGPYSDDFLDNVNAGWSSAFTKLDRLLGVTSANKVVVTARGAQSILIQREFDAPAAAVYEAWTQPESVRQWWPGERGTITSVENDLRVGGSWRYVMETHGGQEVAFHGEFQELVPNERVVSTEIYEPFPDSPSLNTLTLTEKDGRTALTILVECASPEARDAQLGSGMEVGIEEGFDILEQLATGAVA